MKPDEPLKQNPAIQKTDVVIIGSGITGLTLGYYLNKAGKDFIILDQSEYPGGVIRTVSKNGFVFETGPNTGVIGQPEVVQLFDELKGSIVVEEGNQAAKKRYILKNGDWHPMPYNLKLALTTPLFSWKDKLRILGEPLRKPGNQPDETLSQMVLRRMGKSFLHYAVDPFILGVYAGDPSILVTRYALPKLYRLEQDYGSFIKGAIKKSKLPKSDLEKRTNRSVFSIEGGLSQLTNALASKAGEQHLLLAAKDAQVRPLIGSGFEVSYTVDHSSQILQARQVVTTTGSKSLRNLLPFLEASDQLALDNLPYARVVEVALGFSKWKGRPLDGFGLLIPHLEKSNILGIMFMSTLFKKRAPHDGALVSVFIGGIRNNHLYDFTNHEIQLLLADEFPKLTGLKDFQPDLMEINRYEHAIPQYTAATTQRLEAISRVESQFPGLMIGGNLRDGIGMSDRIRQATLLAHSILNT